MVEEAIFVWDDLSGHLRDAYHITRTEDAASVQLDHRPGQKRVGVSVGGAPLAKLLSARYAVAKVSHPRKNPPPP
ncbi:hypothetical protein ACVMYR_28415 [Micromonospora sp. PTRAS2]